MAPTEKENLADYIEARPEAEDPSGSDDAEDNTPLVFELGIEAPEERLDKAVARLMPKASRGRIQKWIAAQAVCVNEEMETDVRRKVGPGDKISVVALPTPEELSFAPEAGVEFDVLYEDRDILIINKPAGLVVHPASGHWSGTLLNGLLYRYPELANVPRAGIVHRLDRDTSGLMVVARTQDAQTDLVRQLQERTVGREYWALVYGEAPQAGFVDRSIGRDPRNALKFVCRGGEGSRKALTHCRLVDVSWTLGRPISWVACRLSTGRTHQIRVHLTTVGLPLLGDPLYKTAQAILPPDAGPAAQLHRQALHASRLRLLHPGTGKTMEWFVEPPEDLAAVMDFLGFEPLDRPVHVFD